MQDPTRHWITSFPLVATRPNLNAPVAFEKGQIAARRRPIVAIIDGGPLALQLPRWPGARPAGAQMPPGTPGPTRRALGNDRTGLSGSAIGDGRGRPDPPEATATARVG